MPVISPLLRLIFCGFVYFYAQGVYADPVGYVVASVGQTHALRAGSLQPLQRSAALQQGDELRTGANSRLVARLQDGSVLTLGADTRLLLNRWQFQEGAQNNRGLFSLVSGVFRMVTGAITQQKNPDLNINTPMGSIGVRGTDFWGGYLDADALDVILLSGEHKIEISNTLGKVLITHPGEGVTIKAGQAPSTPLKWSAEKLQRAVQTISLPE